MRALHFRQYSAQSSALASKNIAIQLQGDLARIRSRWTAHIEAICDVTLMDKVSAVLTSSLDKCVHIWSLDGSRLGSLHQGSTIGHIDPSWAFSPAKHSRIIYERQMMHAEDLLDKVHAQRESFRELAKSHVGRRRKTQQIIRAKS